MRRPPLLLVLLIALGLVSGACGNKSNPGGGATPTSEGSTTTTIPPADQDKAKAQAIVLTQADVGAGYTAKADEPNPDTPQADQAFKECGQNHPTFLDESKDRVAESEFEKDEFTTVASTVEFWTNEAEYKAAFDILLSDAFAGCWDGVLKKLFTETLGSDTAVSSISSAKKTVATPAGIHQAGGFTTTIVIAAGRARVTLVMDITMFRKGRAGALLMTTGATSPAPETDRLTPILSGRLAANAG